MLLFITYDQFIIIHNNNNKYLDFNKTVTIKFNLKTKNYLCCLTIISLEKFRIFILIKKSKFFMKINMLITIYNITYKDSFKLMYFLFMLKYYKI